jgi:serine/threonine protein kinase
MDDGSTTCTIRRIAIMKKYCMRCERINTDGNLFCQDIDCPAERGYPVFEFGDYFGEFKILRLISIWRTAAIYEAERGKYVVWLKIAHPDPLCEERLRREAQLLKALHPPRQSGLHIFLRSFAPQPRPVHLPLLAPFTRHTSNPFGEVSIDGRPRPFFVFMPLEGIPLRSMLLEQPSVWHYEAAWIIAALVVAMRPMLKHGMLHLGIVPDMVLIDVDKDKHWRATLLDYGWMLDERSALPTDLTRRTEAAYQAPELQLRRASAASDAYSLGMLLFEMLSGQQAYDAKLRGDDQVLGEVARRRTALQVNRPELIKSGVVEIIERTLDPDPRRRTSSPLDLVRSLQSIYGPPPPERRERPLRGWVLAIGLVILCGIGALFIIYVLFASAL